MRLSTVVHRAEIPHADHIKGILAEFGATSHFDALTMKNLEKSLKQYFSLVPGDNRNLKSPKYPAGFSSQVNNLFIFLFSLRLTNNILDSMRLANFISTWNQNSCRF